MRYWAECREFFSQFREHSGASLFLLLNVSLPRNVTESPQDREIGYWRRSISTLASL